jgi:hypothetical protein
VNFIADDDLLTIRLQGIEIFFGLKRSFAIPRSRIISLDWQEQFHFAKKVWRTAGSSVIGIIYAGHFRGREQRYFFYLHNPHGLNWPGAGISAEHVLVVSLQDYPYSQIILSCNPDVAAGLVNWWQAGVSAG